MPAAGPFLADTRRRPSVQRLDNRLAARDRDSGARDIAGFISRQHYVNGGQLTWLAGALDGDLLAEMLHFLGGIVDGIDGVQIGPGATQFTRIPFPASNWAKPPVKFWMAPLLAA